MSLNPTRGLNMRMKYGVISAVICPVVLLLASPLCCCSRRRSRAASLWRDSDVVDLHLYMIYISCN